MTRIRKTGIAKGAAGMPPSVPTGLKKRKSRSAAKIRELKRAWAAKRVGADAASGSTVDNTSATEARTTGDPRDVSEEAGSVSVAEDRSSLAAEATATHPDSSVTNPVNRATDSLTSTPDFTDVVTDQATANQNDAGELEGTSGTWVCLVCTWSNTGDVEACTSCKVERSTSLATATDRDAIAGTYPIAAAATDPTAGATDQTAGVTDQTTGATDQVVAATDSMYYLIYGQYYGSDRVTVSGDYATTKKTW
ncbi:hypothetical protein PI125_g18378 [Phytophthora idaei]|nr:hypothetical protein PI125_g18378 [Phytophthora idaei]